MLLEKILYVVGITAVVTQNSEYS